MQPMLRGYKNDEAQSTTTVEFITPTSTYMMARYFTIVFVAICVFQLFQLYDAARLVPRSADAGDPGAGATASDALSKAGDRISETFSSLRDGIQGLVKGAPSLDDVIAGASSTLKKFSDDVSSGVQTLTKKVSSSVNPGSASPANTS